MDNIDQVVEELLKEEEQKDHENSTKKELIAKLSTYHEELKMQNDELKQYITNLISMKERYENIFYESPIAYLILDKDFKIKDHNQTAVDLLAADEINGRPFSHFVTKDSQDELYFHNQRLIKGDPSNDCEIKLNYDDHEKDVKIFGKQLFNENEADFQYQFAIIDKAKDY
ncbi:PAS domain S-box protein [Halalkalibacillus halophilus]|uniref:PAS domain S-box protein n=1 Tax=Halalkalibacillus halophilus TaxID=392827 RepID=UPI000402A905|nr:PAS domain S-box protein [Halalkalibacillus halophilus]